MTNNFCFDTQLLYSARHYKFGDINNNELLIINLAAVRADGNANTSSLPSLNVGSNFRQTVSMRQTLTIFTLVLLFACTDNIKHQLQAENNFSLSNLSIINATFPLILSNINLQDSQNVIQLNDEIENKIIQTVSSYYFNDCLGDSNETYFKAKDTYIGTIRLHDSLQTIFLVLLNHVPSGQVNSKVLFYSNSSKKFIDEAFDFNLHALYEYSNGKIIPSDLKQKFKINFPEIELIQDKKSKQDNFKFTRLYNNGTANAIETTILEVTANKLDTLYFKQNWINN